ncbi:hypothetical protein KPL74_08990 [Bacillus sp. NP157]|nr:hypothetical protein KPL74_08990 [Bacillus sp. NP157]
MKALLLALFLLPAMGVAQDAPTPASTTAKPSFWQKVGGAVKDTGHRIGQEISNPGSGRGDAFRPLTPGASQLVGLFPQAQSGEASMGHLAWPRVAITFEEYGVHQDCWTARARVWSDATSHHDERFQICRSAPVKVTNSLGETGYANPNFQESRLAEGAQALPPVKTTGAMPTEGPNPPTMLFMRDIPTALDVAQKEVVVRLIMITGFRYGISGGGMDYRMWIAGYDTAGNKG